MKNLEEEFKELRDLAKTEEEKIINFEKKIKKEIIDEWEKATFLESLKNNVIKIIMQEFEDAKKEYNSITAELSIQIIKKILDRAENKIKIDEDNLRNFIKKVIEEVDNSVKNEFKKFFEEKSETKEELQKQELDIEKEFSAKYSEEFDTKPFEK